MSPYDLGKGWVMSLPTDPIRRPLLAPWYKGWMENQLPTRSLKLGKSVFFFPWHLVGLGWTSTKGFLSLVQPPWFLA